MVSKLFGTEMILVLPYRGAMTNPGDLQLLQSSDGEFWNSLGSSQVMLVQPARGDVPGYAVIRTSELGHLALADNRGAVIASCDSPESCGY